jgi:hypothetical protein
MDDDVAASATPEATDEDGREKLVLRSLAPQYDPSHHGIYLRALEESTTDSRNQNIALSGSYGVGKSSVLEKFASSRQDLVIEISFSGLRADLPVPPSSEAGTANPAALTKTNQIQKEIVKQLLYREPPAKTPASKYRRPETFQIKRELTVTALMSAALVALAYLTGFLDRPLQAFDVIPAVAAIPAILIWAATTALLFGLRRVLHNRVFIEKLSAGPATIALSTQSSTFFDEYLDEIVYFFQASRRRFVIFEDLDRFDDHEIFQSLGALNTLLNRSAQLSAKPIVFIYAVRDSIFQAPTSPLMDAAEAEVQRANRTKFFDLVIPMVPFVSSRNARDLMTAEIERRGIEISSDLVDLSAKHVADMRLILNVINEFAVYDAVLQPGRSRAPGLTSDKLFALMLYKNVHLFDFEQIRLARSELDTLYEEYRTFVVTAAQDAIDSATHLASSANRSKQQQERAAEYATAVENTLAQSTLSLGLSAGRAHQVSLSGRALTPAEMRAPSTWREIANGELGLDAILNAGYNNQPFTLGFQFLKQITGSELRLIDWDEEPEDTGLRAKSLKESDRIAHLSMQELVAEPSLTVSAPGDAPPESAPLTFSNVLDRTIKSKLARELVRAGHLDEYFGLYAAQYHAMRVSANAMNFIIRRVDRGLSEPLYKLTPDDAESVLRERPEVVGERAILNVSLIEHIVSSTGLPPELTAVLTDSGEVSKEFLTLYFEAGAHKAEFVSQLAPAWEGVLDFVVDDFSIPEPLRVELFSSALDNLSPSVEYEASESVRKYVETNAGAIPLLQTASKPPLATVSWLLKLAPKFPDLDKLGPFVRSIAINHDMYTFTGDNLAQASGHRDVSLDNLAAANEKIYKYAIANLGQYLEIQRTSSPTPFAMRNAPLVVQTLALVAGNESLDRLVESTPASLRIGKLSDVPPAAWRSLALHHRILPTAVNVSSYFEQFEELDDAVVGVVRRRRGLDSIDELATPARSALAIAIIGASGVKDTDRARIAKNLLGNAQIDADVVPRQNGAIFSLLLEKGILTDTGETFSATKGLDWSTRERLIAKSAQFPEYVTPAMLTANEIGHLVRSTVVPWANKKFIYDDLDTWTKNLTGSIHDVARVAFENRLTVPSSDIVILAQKGVSPVWAIAHLLRSSEKRSASEVESILAALGGKYAQLTIANGKRPHFPKDDWHTRLFDLLIPLGKVMRYDPAYWDERKLVVRMNG